MKPLEHETHMGAIRGILEEELGWAFPDHRTEELRAALADTVQEMGFAGLHVLVDHLLSRTSSRQALAILVRRLAVNETCFFRDGAMFRALEEIILPRLIRSRAGTSQSLRIWSAGCSSGEEAYSLAIALLHCLPAVTGWELKIIGTDLSPEQLKRAEAGVYSKWAFREAPPWLEKKHFTPVAGDRRQISAEVRSLVEFQPHNLARGLPDGVRAGSIDLLFCRNVLMYFSAQKAAGILDQFSRCLASDGLLCIAPYEACRIGGAGFEPADVPGSSFFRHHQRDPQAAPAKVRLVPRSSMSRRGNRISRLPAAARNTETASQEPVRQGPPHMEAPVDPYAEVRQLADSGHSWEALEASERVLEAHRLDPELHYLRAIILGECGRPVESASALRQTLYLDPDFLLAHVALANIARAEGREAAAALHFSTARNLLMARRPAEIIAGSGGLVAANLSAIIPKNQFDHEETS